MKIYILTLLSAIFLSNISFAQTLTCEELNSDIEKWNSFKSNNNDKWANAIKDNKLYSMNSDGSFEYVYIMHSKDNLDIATLRKIGFDFINYYFPNIDNATRADMETNSPDNGVIFKGLFTSLGEAVGVFSYSKINGNVFFDIRFKADRIRFSIKIQNYQVIKASNGVIVKNYTQYVNNTYPLNQKSDHKKSYAMAFINANSECLNYASNFFNYVNKHVAESQPTQLEDW